MKILPVACLFLLSAAVLAAKPVESRVTAVTLYPDRAVVTRTAHVGLVAGVNELIFPRLPVGLDERTLQVAARGVAGVTILDVSARRAHLDHAASPRVQELEEQLRQLQRELRHIDDRAAVLADEGKMIDRMEAALLAPPGPEVARPEIAQLTAAAEFITSQRTRLMADRSGVAEEREAQQARIVAVQNQLNELRGSGARVHQTVTVRVDAAAAGELELLLGYTVAQARWTPVYDVRLVGGERLVNLGYQGLARQNTGEDWNEVVLTLSTARPALGGAAPELRPWHLDVWSEPPVAAAPMPRARDGSAMRLSMSLAESDRQDVVVASAAEAAVEWARTSAVFRVHTPVTLPSDNSPRRVPITTLKLNQLPEYRVTPKLATTAYLTAKVVNSSDYPLLAGELNVFLDGTFVATSRLDTIMPEARFELALGADEGIAVERRELQRFTEQIGLRSRTTRVTYEYLITVHNTKRSAERVIVTEQVPLSRNENIVVRVLEPVARELAPDEEGKLTWVLPLAPDEKRELRLKFTIEYPNDVRVAGLP
jgi:uncharacterized protein (TIGR02231 family)